MSTSAIATSAIATSVIATSTIAASTIATSTIATSTIAATEAITTTTSERVNYSLLGLSAVAIGDCFSFVGRGIVLVIDTGKQI